MAQITFGRTPDKHTGCLPPLIWCIALKAAYALMRDTVICAHTMLQVPPLQVMMQHALCVKAWYYN